MRVQHCGIKLEAKRGDQELMVYTLYCLITLRISHPANISEFENFASKVMVCVRVCQTESV